MEKTTNKTNFIFHYRDFDPHYWLYSDPFAFHLLSEFARRTSRLGGDINWQEEIIHLEPGQFITGRISVSRKLGMAEGKYRGALKRLLETGLIKTIRTTKRYSICLYCDISVYGIVYEKKSPSESPSISPSANQLLTTNNTVDTENTVNNDIKSLEVKEVKKSQSYKETTQTYSEKKSQLPKKDSGFISGRELLEKRRKELGI